MRIGVRRGRLEHGHHAGAGFGRFPDLQVRPHHAGADVAVTVSQGIDQHLGVEDQPQRLTEQFGFDPNRYSTIDGSTWASRAIARSVVFSYPSVANRCLAAASTASRDTGSPWRRPRRLVVFAGDGIRRHYHFNGVEILPAGATLSSRE